METGAISGMVTVEPEVLETIARFSALSVPGVEQLVEKDVDRILGLQGKSVVIHVEAGKVTVDLSIVAGPEISLLRLGRAVQYEVTRASQNMIGMPGAYECTLVPNQSGDYRALSCQMEYPLMDGRLSTYGDISTDKRTGDRAVNTKLESQLTPAGKYLYQNLMKMTTGRLLSIAQTAMNYSSVQVIWYPQVPWAAIEQDVRGVFEGALKIAEAVDQK